MNRKRLRLLFAITAVVLLIVEIMIAFYTSGWIRNYLGDVLVVIFLYALYRAVFIERPSKWFVLPSIILIIAFCVEFLQLWGICNRLGIHNRYVLILLGASFSVTDLMCYVSGIVPCFLIEYMMKKRRINDMGLFSRKKHAGGTYDHENKKPIIRASICTGEQIAGFKDLHTGAFEEVMLIRDAADLAEFKHRYGIEGDVEKVY